MAEIGFNTGNLYRYDIPLAKGLAMFRSKGSTAIELSFSTTERLFEFRITKGFSDEIKKFKYVSIHAPMVGVYYSKSKDTERMMEKLRQICKKIKVKGVVFHPTLVDDLEILKDSGLPILLENMDKRQTNYIYPEHFKEAMNKYDFGFVLDLQHAYEHDPSMKIAEDFINTFGNRLKEMHVSGNTKTEMHVPVTISDNKKEISRILKLGVKVPKIEEGVLPKEFEDAAREEILFLNGFEKG
jgi:hypothetical protein